MTTDCQHTIYRTYLQPCLDTKKQSNYHKELPPDKTLDQYKETSGRSTPIERAFNQAESKRNEKQNQYAMSQSTTSSMNKDENNWECMQCSIDNEPSADRCQSCGTP
ncbi:unnamed protein product [Rotaria sordida]|uniref:RanBP2-type domain-containing protein n=1 Tax=Rotaria sordida TaxID=392033 RepID=A0A814C4V7_9BILA|nr:unnamed protein product [Rotaria sordida]CAF4087275.1 unnamed protein product [Rotaria sordida]